MRRRQPLKSNKLKKWLAAPYAVWAAGFIIIPLILILYYACLLYTSDAADE